MTLSVLALLCAATLAPSECDRSNATDVIALGQSANEIACMRDAQETLAALAIRSGPDAYWLVRCERART